MSDAIIQLLRRIEALERQVAILRTIDKPKPAEQTVSPSGIASVEDFGTPSVAPGAVTLSPSGIASAEAFGTAELTQPAAEIAVEETVTGTTASGTSITLPSWTPGSDELILVAVALRDETISPSVSGNSLTFVQVRDVDNVQGQNGVTVFRALGASPSTGSITVTLSGNSLPAVAVASRFSGVDTSGTNGSGAVEADVGDTGPDPNNDDMKTDITTLTDNAWAWGAGTHRGKTFSVPGGETGISINNSAGSGGDATSLSTWYQGPVDPAATVTVGGDADLSGDEDWCMIAVSIKPST